MKHHTMNIPISIIHNNLNMIDNNNNNMNHNPSLNTVMQQQVPLVPITWSGDMRPFSLVGHRDLVNGSLSCAASIPQPSGSLLLGLRLQPALSSSSYSDYLGVIWGIDASGAWAVWPSIQAVSGAPFLQGSLPLEAMGTPGSWHRYRMDVNGSLLSVWMDASPLLAAAQLSDAFPASGQGMIGTQAYGAYSAFDDFALHSSYAQCGQQQIAPGAPVSVVECSSEVGLHQGSLWRFDAAPNTRDSSQIALLSMPDLCISADMHHHSKDEDEKDEDTEETIQDWPLFLAACNASDPLQRFGWLFQGVAPDLEQLSLVFLDAPSAAFPPRCLAVPDPNANIGGPMVLSVCDPKSLYQAFWYDYAAKEIGNEATATCIGIC